MKKVLALILTLVLFGTILVGCNKRDREDDEDDDIIVITVENKYADDFALDYAESSSVNRNKDSVIYKFKPDKYEEFLVEYHKHIAEECSGQITMPRQHTYFNFDIPDIKIGIDEETYENYDHDTFEAQAMLLGETAFKYQIYKENPIKPIPVTYRNADTGEVYFVVEVTAE